MGAMRTLTPRRWAASTISSSSSSPRPSSATISSSSSFSRSSCVSSGPGLHTAEEPIEDPAAAGAERLAQMGDLLRVADEQRAAANADERSNAPVTVS